MLVNVVFDEDSLDLDIIDIPEELVQNISVLQENFFKWLFDKKIDHAYWVCDKEIKKYCSYRSEAFVEWINNVFNCSSNQEARIIEQYSSVLNVNALTIYF